MLRRQFEETEEDASVWDEVPVEPGQQPPGEEQPVNPEAPDGVRQEPNSAAPQLSNPSPLPATMSNATPGNTQAGNPAVTVSPFTEADNVPGPTADNPALLPGTSDPAGASNNSPANPDQIGQGITIGLQTIPQVNTALGIPAQPDYTEQSALVP